MRVVEQLDSMIKSNYRCLTTLKPKLATEGGFSISKCGLIIKRLLWILLKVESAYLSTALINKHQKFFFCNHKK